MVPLACAAGGAEALPEQRFQSLQGPVRQHRGDDAALRAPLGRGEEDVLFQITSAQPLPEDDLVHGGVGHQPVMTDPIKASADIALEDPGGAVVLPQDLVTLIQGVGTAPLTAEAVGVGIGQRFLDRIEAEQVPRLHGSIAQGGNP